MWLEIRGRKGRKNTTRKSTNGQETDNEYINEIRNGGVGGGAGLASSDVQRKFFHNLYPFVPNVSTTTLLYTTFAYPIYTILFP